MTTTTVRTLTATDVKALRAATAYSVHLDGTVAKLHLTKDLPSSKTGPFTASDRTLRHDIVADVGTTKVAYFGDLYTPGTWRALAALVKPGDRLVFEAMTNNNGYMDAAEIPAGKMEDHRSGYPALFVDELRVTILRPKKDGGWKRVVGDWLISYTITPNNSARAIRPQTYSLVRSTVHENDHSMHEYDSKAYNH